MSHRTSPSGHRLPTLAFRLLSAVAALASAGPLTAPLAAQATGTPPAGQDTGVGSATETPKAALGTRVPEHTFREFLSGGDGRQNLSEFRGQPVLIVNWTDTDFGLGAATQAKKLAEELVPAGLVCILMDSHNRKDDEILASAMRLYPGSPSRFMRTQKLPVAYLDNGPPPDIALIGVDGTLLLAGSYTIDLSKAEKLVKAELKKAKAGWGTHDAARDARALAFGQRRLDKAYALIEAALATESDGTELREVRAEILTRLQSWERSIQVLTEQGRCEDALAAAHSLQAAVASHVEWAARAAAAAGQLQTPEAVSELALERKLAAVLDPLAKRKPSEADAARLRKLADGAGDTPVARRARRLADIAALSAGS